MDYTESETQRDMELHGRVVPIDCQDFRATPWASTSVLASGWTGIHNRNPVPPCHQRKMPTCRNMSLDRAPLILNGLH